MSSVAFRPPRHGRGRGRVGARPGFALVFAAALFVVAACGATNQPVPSGPAISIGPGTTVSPAVNQTRAELVRVLGTASLVLTDTQAPVRPAESILLTTAPRAIFQVILPADPTRGFIVVYEFRDANLAAEAAAEEQHYLASGPGRVQTPEGTEHVLRQLGPTVILYDWLPGAARDPSAPDVARVLETLGVSFPVDR